MKLRFTVVRLLMVMAIVLASFTAFAQDGTEEPAAPEGEGAAPPMEMPPLPEGAEVVAQGLNFPRLLTIGDDGTIYVAIIGPGGETIVSTPEGDVPFGMTSEVLAISPDGSQVPLLSGFPSAAGIGGATAVDVSGDSIWVAVSGPGPETVPQFLMASAFQFSSADNHLVDYVDLYGYEIANDPDGNGVDTNTTDVFVASDGTVYIVDAGANTLFTWTAEGGLEPFVIWPDNPVPTAVDEGPDGNLAVSFLGAEIAPGAGKVEVYSPAGELVETYAGFNALTDVTIAEDGSIYAVSFLSGFGEQGPLPGQVLHVNSGAEGGEVVVDGLLLPYGIALEADGSMLVTTGASFLPPGAGMVLRFPAHTDAE